VERGKVRRRKGVEEGELEGRQTEERRKKERRKRGGSASAGEEKERRGNNESEKKSEVRRRIPVGYVMRPHWQISSSCVVDGIMPCCVHLSTGSYKIIGSSTCCLV